MSDGDNPAWPLYDVLYSLPFFVNFLTLTKYSDAN